MDFECRGVWFEILCLMHESDRRGVLTLNGQPMPDEALARLLGISLDLLKQILTKIEAHGVASREEQTGALVNRRMVRDQKLREIRQEAGKQGGNPALVKQKPTTRDNQNPTPSSSSSSSSSSSESSNPPAAVPPERRVYDLYPRKVGPKKAIEAIQRALKTVTIDHLLQRTKMYAEAVACWPTEDREKYVPHPTTWFNRGSYDDDPGTWRRGSATGKIHRANWA